jgi:hypothetical protein
VITTIHFWFRMRDTAILRLQDNLYGGLLADRLRLDIDYIPHIGIGNSKDKFKCKEMADSWNRQHFAISGKIIHLTLVNYADNKVASLEQIELH